MTQTRRIELRSSIGYALKEAASALRAAMEEALRPLGLNVTQYSCLELLRQRPGLSNSELARGAFVTRQSMNVLLQGLEDDGLVIRPEEARTGRIQPATLTARGRKTISDASSAVRSVELAMLADVSADDQERTLRVLRAATAALRGRL